MSAELVQVLSPCPTCRVEAALVELVELVGQGTRVYEGRCRMCGRWEREGSLLDPGIRFTERVQVEAALSRWAAREGESDLQAFLESGFGGQDLDAVCDALLTARPVETTFDVIAWLFPGMAGGGSRGDAQPSSPPASASSAHASPPPARPSPALPAEPPPPEAPPGHRDSLQIALQALITVMLADGAVRPGERAFIDGFADRAGLPRPGELRSWRPLDLASPDRPDLIIHAMIDLALIDRERDGSELQVIREFARAWGQPLDGVDARFARAAERQDPAAIRLWRSLRRLILVEDKAQVSTPR